MTPKFRALPLSGVFEIGAEKCGDERGFVSETFSRSALRELGIDVDWVQDNHSFSERAGVVRGLHFQLPPYGQDKLVRVSRGRIWDVVVDIRKGSESYGKWFGLEISAKQWNQIFVPQGFAHGIVTLEPQTEVIYKLSAPFSPEHERVIRYDDPAIGIDWRIDAHRLTVSEKDRAAPLMRETDTGFGDDADQGCQQCCSVRPEVALRFGLTPFDASANRQKTSEEMTPEVAIACRDC